MARFRFEGREYAGTIKGQVQPPNGHYVVIAAEHGPRWVPGTEIHVLPIEMIDLDPKAPDTPKQTIEDLQKAMDEGRENLPKVEDLLADAPKTFTADAPAEGVSVPVRPT